MNRNKNQSNNKSIATSILDSNMLFVMIPIVFVLLYPMVAEFFNGMSKTIVEMLLYVIIFLSVVFIIIKYPMDKSNMILTIFIIGTVLRISYTFYTSIYTRQHDVESVDSFGHLSYIMTIYQNHKLPDSNNWQFYQPPLHHIISALWLGYMNIWGIPTELALESLSVLTLIYSVLTMIVIYKILKLFKLSDKALTFAYMLIVLHPTFIILSGSVNNDMLGLFLQLLTILYILKWCISLQSTDIVLTAIFLAFSALTKISSLMLALPIGFIFLAKLLDKNRKIWTSTLWGQYTTFAFISIPIALSHSIYSMIRFNQPLGYVPMPGDETSPIFVGNHSFVDRFIKPFGNTFFHDIFPNVGENYNLPEYIIKNSLFNEYSFGGKEIIAIFLIFMNIILVIISLYAMIMVALSFRDGVKKNLQIPVISMYILWLTLMISHVTFNIKFPFACTMDFRYIVPTLLTGALFLGLFFDESKKHKPELSLYFNKLAPAYITIFSSLSVIFYIFG